MVRTLPSNEGGRGLIPGWGTGVPHAEGYNQKLKKTKPLVLTTVLYWPQLSNVQFPLSKYAVSFQASLPLFVQFPLPGMPSPLPCLLNTLHSSFNTVHIVLPPPASSLGQRSLAGYSPWGCKESDTTEQLSTCSL